MAEYAHIWGLAILGLLITLQFLVEYQFKKLYPNSRDQKLQDKHMSREHGFEILFRPQTA